MIREQFWRGNAERRQSGFEGAAGSEGMIILSPKVRKRFSLIVAESDDAPF
jgi:hypothetical protein